MVAAQGLSEPVMDFVDNHQTAPPCSVKFCNSSITYRIATLLIV